MKILMLGSSEIKLNAYRYDLCRSLLFGEDIEVETTREGAVRTFVGGQRPDLVILDGELHSVAVTNFISWLKNLPFSKTVGLKVVLMKKGTKPSQTEREVHALSCKKSIFSPPINARELKEFTYNFHDN